MSCGYIFPLQVEDKVANDHARLSRAWELYVVLSYSIPVAWLSLFQLLRVAPSWSCYGRVSPLPHVIHDIFEEAGKEDLTLSKLKECLQEVIRTTGDVHHLAAVDVVIGYLRETFGDSLSVGNFEKAFRRYFNHWAGKRLHFKQKRERKLRPKRTLNAEHVVAALERRVKSGEEALDELEVLIESTEAARADTENAAKRKVNRMVKELGRQITNAEPLAVQAARNFVSVAADVCSRYESLQAKCEEMEARWRPAPVDEIPVEKMPRTETPMPVTEESVNDMPTEQIPVEVNSFLVLLFALLYFQTVQFLGRARVSRIWQPWRH